MKVADAHTWPKSFLYLSPVKVDSLFNQIDGRTVRRIAKKLTINLKLVGAEFESPERPETVCSRLRVVLNHLEQKSMIGTVDAPGQYVRGSLPMRWGPYGMDSSPRVVLFAGQTDETVLGMGGSIENTFGGTAGPPMHSHSGTAALLQVIARADSTAAGPDSDAPVDDWELRATRLAVSGAKGPLQTVEFVAKKLIWGSLSSDYSYGLEPSRTMLATPLYVAQAD